jgi:hypothetical protein
MCCSTKMALLNVILWLISLIGLAPAATGWIDSFERWTGYEQALQPVTHIYASTESQDLRVFVFSTGEAEDTHTQPAVVTAFRPSDSQSEPEAVFAICSDLAQIGYTAIAFETPSEQEDDFEQDESSDALLATAWLVENADGLGVDLSRTVPLAISDQPLLGLQLIWDLMSREGGVEHEVIVLPEGVKCLPSELVPLLPSLL